jgi:hypothetical protein
MVRAMRLTDSLLSWASTRSTAATPMIDFNALRTVMVVGARSEAWLLQQAQADPHGIEARLSVAELITIPDLPALHEADGKRALWRTWCRRRR